jgi:hypothetical protein
MTKDTGRRLRDSGFDRSEYDRASRSYRVRCSRCEATVVNGVACHERGCPNLKRGDEDDY